MVQWSNKSNLSSASLHHRSKSCLILLTRSSQEHNDDQMSLIIVNSPLSLLLSDTHLILCTNIYQITKRSYENGDKIL